MRCAVRTIRSGIAVALICGSFAAFSGAPPWTVSLVTQASAAEGVRSVKSVCEWNDVGWQDMSAAEQAAWKTLGWRAETWGSDDPAAEPETSQKDWAELAANEKQAAETLGYNQKNWNVDPDPCEGK